MTARGLKALVQPPSPVLSSHGAQSRGAHETCRVLQCWGTRPILPGGDLVSRGRWASLGPQGLPSLPGKGPAWGLSRHRTSEPLPGTRGDVTVGLGWPAALHVSLVPTWG